METTAEELALQSKINGKMFEDKTVEDGKELSADAPDNDYADYMPADDMMDMDDL